MYISRFHTRKNKGGTEDYQQHPLFVVETLTFTYLCAYLLSIIYLYIETILCIIYNHLCLYEYE